MSIVCIPCSSLDNVINIPMYRRQSSHTAASAGTQGYRSGQKIVLIEGARLAALMIKHNMCVSIAQAFALKRLDTDFFEEDLPPVK